MAQTVIPVTDNHLLQQATLNLGNYTSSYSMDAWRNFHKNMINSNVIYLGKNNYNNVLTKHLNDYLHDLLANICQQIFAIFDNNFKGLNAINILQYDNCNHDLKIINYHRKQAIKINIALAISISDNFEDTDSYYHIILIDYMVQQFNAYFAQQDFNIIFHPNWLLVTNDDNQYQLMLDEENLVEQLSSLKVKILEQAQQFIKQLILAKNAINQINQQGKQLNLLMDKLEYAIVNEHNLINNLCDYRYYHYNQLNNDDYVSQMTPVISKIHQNVKTYDDKVINYLHQINIDNETIKATLKKYISEFYYYTTIEIDKDLQLGVLFSNIVLNDKINSLNKLNASNDPACRSLFANSSCIKHDKNSFRLSVFFIDKILKALINKLI